MRHRQRQRTDEFGGKIVRLLFQQFAFDPRHGERKSFAGPAQRAE